MSIYCIVIKEKVLQHFLDVLGRVPNVVRSGNQLDPGPADIMGECPMTGPLQRQLAAAVERRQAAWAL